MKKLLYLLLVIILRIMLSFAMHVVILVQLGDQAIPQLPIYMRYTTLPVWAQLSVVIIGVFFGSIVGRRRWRIVYIEHRHRRDRLAKK